MAQETDAKIQFPAVSPTTFTIGGDANGHESAFAVDEVRISNDEMPAAGIAYDASRLTPFANDEVFLSLTGVSPGQLNYVVPAADRQSITSPAFPSATSALQAAC